MLASSGHESGSVMIAWVWRTNASAPDSVAISRTIFFNDSLLAWPLCRKRGVSVSTMSLSLPACAMAMSFLAADFAFMSVGPRRDIEQHQFRNSLGRQPGHGESDVAAHR